MDDPIGYFLTWVTYGTWLPGDSRGWVEHRHGWQLPDPVRELEASARMTEDACRLRRNSETRLKGRSLKRAVTVAGTCMP